MKTKIGLIQILGWACIAEAGLGGGLYLYNKVAHQIPIPSGEITSHAAFGAIGVLAIVIAGVLSGINDSREKK
jgi:hypothetical protein